MMKQETGEWQRKILNKSYPEQFPKSDLIAMSSEGPT